MHVPGTPHYLPNPQGELFPPVSLGGVPLLVLCLEGCLGALVGSSSVWLWVKEI